MPLKTDKDVTEAEFLTHHVLLIGRPEVNTLAARWRDAFPVQLGPRSFTVAGETYAHPASALIVAGDNPANRRYSTILIAGLGGAATLRVAPALAGTKMKQAEAIILAHDGKPRFLVLPHDATVQRRPFGDAAEKRPSGTTSPQRR